MLVQLQECRIESCNDMEEIIFKEVEDEETHDDDAEMLTSEMHDPYTRITVA